MEFQDELRDLGLAFESSALSQGDLRLLGVEGREQISTLFEFNLLLARRTRLSSEELDGLMQLPCAIALGPGAGDVVHGLVDRIDYLDNSNTDTHRYVARLVPMFALLRFSQISHIYQNLTVLDMIRQVLARYGLQEGRDYAMLVQPNKRLRQYAVQYQETDWDFIQRWLEREGLFYWFEHPEGGERLVIADRNQAATAIGDPSTISYRERNNLSAEADTVWDWDLRRQRVAARVAVLDYNYRRPDRRLRASAEVAVKDGFGTVVSYGHDFQDEDEAQAIAAIRAQALACRRLSYSAWTDCARFRAGHKFTLRDHYDDEANREYLVTAVEHRVGYAVGDERDEHDDHDEPELLRYRAGIEVIPLDVPFRPLCRTPWPRVEGLLTGHIAAESSGQTAAIDEYGRYRVKMPFDTSEATGSAASVWIRMAQSYAGAGYGTHYPLHRGTEVLIDHLGANPDQPIIVGAVPNPHTVSPSTNTNASQSVVQTASGIRIEMEDLQKRG